MTSKLLVAFVFASTTLCAQSKEEVALNNLAVSLMDKGDYKEALAYLDKLTASDENNFIYRTAECRAGHGIQKTAEKFCCH